MRYRFVSAPSQIVSQRLIIRELNPIDESAFGHFMDACEQHYPITHLNWPFDKQGYANTDCDDILATLKNSAIKRYYIFKKGQNNRNILGTIGIQTDRERAIRVGFYISPPYRRKQFGQEAHQSVLNALKKMNPRQIIQEQCEIANTGAKRLLLSNGFNYVGIRMASNHSYKEKGKPLLTFRRVL